MTKFFKSLLAVLIIGAITAATIYFTQGGDQLPARAPLGAGPTARCRCVAAAGASSPTCRCGWRASARPRRATLVTVRPQVDGKILSINFKEGQEVKRGDLLAQIDPVTYQAQLDQAVAKKALDEVQLANAKRDLERYTQPCRQRHRRQDDRHPARAGRAARGADQVRRGGDRQRARHPRLHHDRRADRRPHRHAHGRRRQPRARVRRRHRRHHRGAAHLRAVHAAAAAPARDQQGASPSARSQVEALETDSKSVLDRACWRSIDNQVDQTTGTIRMKAEFPNNDLQLWPGQFVNVRLLLETLEQVVVVPTVGGAARPRRHLRLRRRRGQQGRRAHRHRRAADDTIAVDRQGPRRRRSAWSPPASRASRTAPR